ncbi:MAG: hypothetical protein ABIW33_03925 [Sphingomicrobium sp.]
MPGTRPVRKGSFGGHFDGLVPLFPAPPCQRPKPSKKRAGRSAKLQDKIDIHTVLFEMAWPVNRPQ